MPQTEFRSPRTAGPPVLAAADRGSIITMIEHEWGALRRMVLLHVARQERLGQGFPFGSDPIAIAAVERSLNVRWTRIALLAGAAGLTDQQAATVWDHHGVEGMRRLAQVSIETHDDLALEAAWRAIARHRDVEEPPYLREYVGSGNRAAPIRVLPPTVEELAVDALAALRAGNETTGSPSGAAIESARSATTAAETMTAVPAPEWQPVNTAGPAPPEIGREAGAEPD